MTLKGQKGRNIIIAFRFKEFTICFFFKTCKTCDTSIKEKNDEPQVHRTKNHYCGRLEAAF